MMLKRTVRLPTTLLALAMLASACGFEHSTTLTPTVSTGGGTNPAARSFVGTWVSGSTATGLPDPSSCSALLWKVTSQTPTSMTGDFSAVCGGNVTITGTASGELGSGTTIPMKASGSATAPGSPPCPFSLAGTGTVLDNDTMRVDYVGTTCSGPVHGTETLRRQPTPTPTPPPG